MIYAILTAYIINATLSALFLKKNKVNSVDTLLSIAVVGLIINGLVFFVAAFLLSLLDNVTYYVLLMSVLRGILIVAGLLFMVKAFRHLPVSLMSPIGMVAIVPLLFLSWAIFGDEVSIVVIVLVIAMLAACIVLVVLEGRHVRRLEADTDSGTPKAASPTSDCDDKNTTPLRTTKKSNSFWVGIICLVLAMICFLSTQIITRFLGDWGVHMLTITFFNSVVVFIVALIIFAALKRNPIKTFCRDIKSGIMIGVAITDAVWLFMYVPLVMAMNLGVLNAVSRISVALVVLCGIFIFKERLPKSAYPLIIVVIGLGVTIGLLV